MATIGAIKVPIDFQMTDASKDLISGLINEQLRNKVRIAELDAALNGTLVEVGQIYGKALYIRDDTNDPEQLRYVVEQIQSAFRWSFSTPKESK